MTPARAPQLAASSISARSAVSRKNFTGLLLKVCDMRTSIRAHGFSTCLFAKGILKVICTEAFLCEDKVAQLKHGGKHLPAHRQ